MYDVYCVKNLSSWKDDMTFKCPLLAYQELERRQAAGIECEVFYGSSHDDDYTGFYESDPVPLDALAQSEGLAGLSERLRGYSE